MDHAHNSTIILTKTVFFTGHLTQNPLPWPVLCYRSNILYIMSIFVVHSVRAMFALQGFCFLFFCFVGSLHVARPGTSLLICSICRAARQRQWMIQDFWVVGSWTITHVVICGWRCSAIDSAWDLRVWLRPWEITKNLESHCETVRSDLCA